jgi:acyl carrier protein
METLVLELKKLIIDSLDLEDVAPEDINPEAPLFGMGLGLDSIDALELGIAIRKKYKVSFPEDKAENRKHFASVNALAEFIINNKK